ncbi:MAG: hypothetical protein IT305_17860 [Chloroflexi bacterium]|nr:hypothetical protein [Chloroflexota bacterium]
MASEVVHAGQTHVAYDTCAQVPATAYAAHPEHFVRQASRLPQLPTAVWINPPAPTTDAPNPSQKVPQ